MPSPDERPTPTNQLNHITIGTSDVYTALVTLDTSKAAGPDDIDPLILKTCADALTTPLTHLLNTCLQTCSVPEEWKVHKIVPIPKGSDPSDVHNYHPISLLCILPNILETIKIVYDKIIDFILPQISSQQFGFLRKRSCVNQLLSFYSQIFSSVDQKNPCDVIFLDFRKAFDTLPHPELLYKL